MGTGLWVVLRDDRFLLKLTDAELVALLRSLALSPARPGGAGGGGGQPTSRSGPRGASRRRSSYSRMACRARASP